MIPTTYGASSFLTLTEVPSEAGNLIRFQFHPRGFFFLLTMAEAAELEAELSHLTIGKKYNIKQFSAMTRQMLKFAGLELVNTGGGCTALRRDYGQYYVLVTDNEGISAPTNLSDGVWVVQYDGDEIMTRECTTLTFREALHHLTLDTVPWTVDYEED